MTLKKINILLIILLIGFFVSPKLSYDYTNMVKKSDMSCCKKSKSDNSSSNNCCKKNNDKNKHQKNQCNNCAGQNACHCSYSCQNIVVADIIELESKIYLFETSNQKNYQNKNFISRGFLSIWLPPKIG